MKKQEFSLADIPLPDTTLIERQVIADAVDNSGCMADFMAVITPDMFTSDVRKYLWDSLVYMFNHGETIDLASYSAKTGNYFLNEIMAHNYNPSTPSTAYEHALQLRATAIKRRAYFAAAEMLQAAVNPNATEVSMYDAAQALANKIQGANPIVTERSLSAVVKEVGETIEQTRELKKEGKLLRIPTSIASLDGLTYQGWRGGQLIVLAARPSVGKTAIMLQMARTAAKNGFPAVVFSLEMTRDELCQRLLFAEGRITQAAIARGEVDNSSFQQSASALSSLPLYINDESRTIDSIISRMTIAVYQGRCKIGFIDYLSLISEDGTGREPLYQIIARITRELKLAALKLKIPIVLLCQLNRGSVKDDRPPELYDLRDSGSIEQDADIVLMLEQKKQLSINQDQQTIERPVIDMWVRKNRQYKKDVLIKLQPNESYTVFTELVKPSEEARYSPPPAYTEPPREDNDLPF